VKNLRPLRLGGSKDNVFRKRRINRLIKKLVPVTLVVAILVSLAIFLTTLSGSSVVNYIFSGTSLRSTGGQVNVLLLGIAGGTHDGANLTDTIMVASYNLKTNQVYLISIPRDLWLPSFKAKANAIYEIGLAQNNGLGLSKTVMGNIVGIPIHYGLRVDFRGFVKAIDILGGLDVEVDRSFDDFNYPIEGKEDNLCGFTEQEKDFSAEEAKSLNIEPGKAKVLVGPDGKIATDSAQEDKGAKYFSCRYEHISFNKGLVHLDGETALKFVRSRHGTGNEGSDFARAKRQQKVLEAAKAKLLSFETLTNPEKIRELTATFGRSIDTDISVKDVVEFYKLFKKVDKIHNFVLDNSSKANLPNGRSSLLIQPPASDYGGAFVLISEDDDFSIVQGYVRKIVTGEITEYEQSSNPRIEDATASARPGN